VKTEQELRKIHKVWKWLYATESGLWH